MHEKIDHTDTDKKVICKRPPVGKTFDDGIERENTQDRYACSVSILPSVNDFRDEKEAEQNNEERRE
jgi:hypothetical protein